MDTGVPKMVRGVDGRLDELAQAGIGPENILLGQRLVCAPALPVELLGYGVEVVRFREFRGQSSQGVVTGRWDTFLDPQGRR